jgi:hypothetical protein
MKMDKRRVLELCLTLMVGGLFSACLDIPEPPGDTPKITSVQILVKQFDDTKGEPLKINSDEDAELIAEVNPDKFKNDIKYFWYKGNDILGKGMVYPINSDDMASSEKNKQNIPDKLVIEDSENNQLKTTFQITINVPPQISTKTKPANGDTLYGNTHTPILFSWQSSDRNEDKHLSHVLEIDGIRYNVGELQQISQSGFSEGKHTYRILVEDSLGDKDSIPEQEFFVIDTLETK